MNSESARMGFPQNPKNQKENNCFSVRGGMPGSLRWKLPLGQKRLSLNHA
jgi:hypothetical protein